MMGFGFGGGMLLFWLVVIGLVVWGFASNRTGDAPRRERSALDLLEERYARGEIDGSEYRERRAALG